MSDLRDNDGEWNCNAHFQTQRVSRQLATRAQVMAAVSCCVAEMTVPKRATTYESFAAFLLAALLGGFLGRAIHRIISVFITLLDLGDLR